MAVVYIIVAVVAGLAAGAMTYSFAGFAWALLAYVGAGTVVVFTLAALRALTLRDGLAHDRVPAGARVHGVKN